MSIRAPGHSFSFLFFFCPFAFVCFAQMVLSLAVHLVADLDKTSPALHRDKGALGASLLLLFWVAERGGPHTASERQVVEV